MLIKDKFLITSMSLVVLQQIILGCSTFFIARAGANIATGEFDAAASNVTLFFMFALLGYCMSSLAELSRVRGSNAIWSRYINKVLRDTNHNTAFSSEKNKQKYESWMIGEAHDTIDYGSSFCVGFMSIVLNVIITVSVFYLVIGPLLAGTIIIGMAIAGGFTYFFKRKVEQLAVDIQEGRSSIAEVLGPLWNSHFFGSKKLYGTEAGNMAACMRSYFSSKIQYSKLEQVVACVPVFISVIMLIAYVQLRPPYEAALWGAIVAVLPRTLQLFGSVHSLIVYSTQAVMLKKRLSNLSSFVGSLSLRDLDASIMKQEIVIKDVSNSSNVSMEHLLDRVKVDNPIGRIMISGANGVGKSTLLMSIKKDFPNSIMLTPMGPIFSTKKELSSGQSQFFRIREIFNDPSSILLLDEWDANLDSVNIAAIEELIDVLSKKHLVIEVRHRNVVGLS